MIEKITVSKIVGSPHENAWAQASSTGKLYVALSLSSDEGESGIITKGKETLEQIQREFFALDEKKLINIKRAIEKIFSEITDVTYSAVVATITNDILYVITAGESSVIINRNNNLAEVARGELGKIIGFSGYIEDNDLIILETKKFNTKVSNKLLAEYTGTNDVEKISENLAPFIIENSYGEEAAVIISYKNSAEKAVTDPYPEDLPEIPKHHEKISDEVETEPDFNTKNHKKPLLFGIFEKLKISSLTKKQKRIAIFAVVIIALLITSLIAERAMDAKRVKDENYAVILKDASESLESANALASLNRGRALEETTSAIGAIETNLKQFSTNSKEYKNLDELLTKLKTLRETLGSGENVSGNVIFTASKSEILKDIQSISESKGSLIIAGKNGYAVINEEGEIDSEQEVDLSIKDTISTDSNLYILDSNIDQVTISNGNKKQIIEGSGVDISFFGSNIYLLTSGGEVKKYSGSSFSESNYFSEKPNFSGNPISLAIDSSIYVLTDNSSIQKFAKGAQDSSFSLDSSVKISRNASLYTHEDFDHIYILDIDNSSVVQLDTTGNVIKQFNSNELQNAKSFTVNSSESKVFVVIGDQVYSYDL